MTIILGLAALPGRRTDNREHQSGFQVCLRVREQWPFHSKSGSWLSLSSPQVTCLGRLRTERAGMPCWSPSRSEGSQGSRRGMGTGWHGVLSPWWQGGLHRKDLHCVLGHYYSSTLSLALYIKMTFPERYRNSNLHTVTRRRKSNKAAKWDGVFIYI